MGKNHVFIAFLLLYSLSCSSTPVVDNCLKLNVNSDSFYLAIVFETVSVHILCFAITDE